MEIKALLEQLSKEDVSIDEIEQAGGRAFLPPIEIPLNISIESTIKEIESISTRLHNLHQASPRDPIILNKIVSLLELKMKLLGMTNVKPDMQAIIDSEINNYKARFLAIVYGFVDNATMKEMCEILSKEGL